MRQEKIKVKGMEIKRILETMNEKERAELICGGDDHTNSIRLIPALKIGHDGFKSGVAVFPSAAAIASSWDTALAYAVGREHGADCCASGIHVTEKVPALCFPLPSAGERYRCLSSSTMLSNALAAAYIDGVQSTGTGACICFKGNARELKDALSSIKPKALKLGREDFSLGSAAKNAGYNGVVIASCGCADDRSEALKKGIDLTFGSAFDERERLAESLESGEITEEMIKDSAERVLTLIDETFDDHEYNVDKEQQRAKSTRFAEECIVLLKNDGALPLAGDGVTVMGALAERIFATGEEGGEEKAVSLVCELKRDRRVKFVQGYDEGEDLSEEALEKTYPAESVVVVLGAYEPDCPLIERETVLPEEQLVLCERLKDSGRDVIAVVVGGGCVDLSRLTDMSAVMYAPYLGCGAAAAIKRVVCGETSPCGRLCEDFCGASDVIYPLGHGLTYSDFTYGFAKIAGGKVTLELGNEGRYSAAETVQVYDDKGELIGFVKAILRAGERRAVGIDIPDFLVRTEHLYVGASKGDIRQTIALPEDYPFAEKTPVEVAEREKTTEPEGISLMSPLSDIAETVGGKRLLKKVNKLALEAADGNMRRAERLARAAENLPMYMLCALSGGAIDIKSIESCVAAKESVIGAILKRVGKGDKKDNR